LEDALGEDETESAAILQKSVCHDVSHEHRNVFLAFPRYGVHAAMREEAVSLPDRLCPVAVGLREALPVHPRRISHDDVERAEEYRPEGVAQDSSPDAVEAAGVEFNDPLVEFLYKRAGLLPVLGRYLDGSAEALEESIDRSAGLHAVLDQFG